MLDKIRPHFQPVAEVLAKPFMKLHPNLITAIGASMALFYVYFMSRGEYWLALLVLALSSLDFIDGLVARATGKTSAFGGFFDSTMDRLADVAYFLGLGFALKVDPIWISVVIAISLLISYTRSRYELAVKGNDRLAVGIIERPERLLFIGVLTLYFALGKTVEIFNTDLSLLLFYILVVLSAITLLQRIYESWKRLSS